MCRRNVGFSKSAVVSEKAQTDPSLGKNEVQAWEPGIIILEAWEPGWCYTTITESTCRTCFDMNHHASWANFFP